MKRALRNVTITLEEQVVQWVRLEAAKQDTSISQFLGQILKQRMHQEDQYQRAMARALKRKPFLRTDGHYLSREEAHDRERLR